MDSNKKNIGEKKSVQPPGREGASGQQKETTFVRTAPKKESPLEERRVVRKPEEPAQFRACWAVVPDFMFYAYSGVWIFLYACDGNPQKNAASEKIFCNSVYFISDFGTISGSGYFIYSI